jgi:hypothetical protein
VRDFFCVMAGRLNCVGNAAAPDFLVVHLAIGFAGKGEAEPLEAHFRRGRLAFPFERSLRCGNKKQSIQTQFFHRRLRDEQVAEMNRVERAAIQSKPLHGEILNLRWPFGDGNPARQKLKIVDLEIRCGT